MQPIYGWETIEEAGTYKKIELGGHICVIEGARIEATKSGGQMMVIAFDFAPNDKQPRYFKDMFESDKKRNPQTKWRGVFYQNFGTEQSNPFFKRLINRIIESNPGYQWDWNESGLKGKRFGGVFGREEYINDKGESKFSIKCMSVQNLDGIFEAEIPEDKLLQKDEPSFVQNGTKSETSSNILEIDNDDLPF